MTNKENIKTWNQFEEFYGKLSEDEKEFYENCEQMLQEEIDRNILETIAKIASQQKSFIAKK